MMTNDFLSVSDMASRLGVSRSRIYQLAAEGRIPYIRTGRLIRVPKLAWDEWLADQSREALSAVNRVEARPAIAA